MADEMDRLGTELEELKAEVTETREVIDRAIVRFRDLARQLKEAVAQGNMARVAAIADGLDATTRGLDEKSTELQALLDEPEDEGEPAPV